MLIKLKCIWKYFVNHLHRKTQLIRKLLGTVPKEDENIQLKGNDQEVVTSTLVELREPLIDNDDI